MSSPLDAREIARYGRHLTLPEVGIEGQQKLRASSALLVGAGGLGSPLALYLAAAGVGRIGLVDFDVVDLSNLQRQVLYGTEDIGQPKVQCAAERIRQINPHVEVEIHAVRLDASNAGSILSRYDVIVDGTDNFPTRYLVNDACVLLDKPNVYGSIFRFEGQVSLFRTGQGPCYRCLYPEPPPAGAVPNCAEGGVLGILPGVIGCLQATEAIKWMLGRGTPLIGRLLLFNALEMSFRELRLRRDPDCPVCGEHPTIGELSDLEATCQVGETAVAETLLPDGDTLEVHRLRAWMDSGDGPLLLDVRTPMEWQICRIEGATLMPLQELTGRFGELDSTRPTVVYCHVGVRSAMAVRFLKEQGFENVFNLAGGINSWSIEIAPDVPRY